MKMCVGGKWVETGEKIEVLNPYDNTVVDTVPRARAGDVEAALAAAARGAKIMVKLTAWERYQILKKTAEKLEARAEEFARTITLEEGKTITEGRFEVGRAVETLMLSAEEARRIHGETVPLDASPGGAGKMGFTLRVPCGGGDQPVQLSVESRGAQSGASHRGGQRGDHQTAVEHAAFGAQANGIAFGMRVATRRDLVCDGTRR
jgi:hypothetical protein